MTHAERIDLIRELAAHTLAFMLVIGFLGLAYIAVLGYVDLNEPVAAGFLGTVLGAVGAKVEPPIVRYFSSRRIKDAE